MQKKQSQRNNKFDLTNERDIASLSQSLKDVEEKYPIVFDFLESYCGYNSPLLTYEPNEICYSQGKRDVILTIKTLMRDDIDAKQIAEYYKTI